MKLSVLLPTYNPDPERLSSTLKALKAQTLNQLDWELLIIDNNSSNNFQKGLDLTWHQSARVLSEQQQGLTYARLCGFRESVGQVLVMVDDDNVLRPNYLELLLNLFRTYPLLGACGGKSLPIFEIKPPHWLAPFYGNLALRDLGETAIFAAWEQCYPPAAPIGAGMGIRREALAAYIQKAERHPNTLTDRTATSLSSGGDNDIILEILKSGWRVAYFPELELQHIIPAQRMNIAYLARLVHDTNCSWVEVLDRHGINPWTKISRQSLVPRKIKAWFHYKAWKGNAAYIHYKSACGLFDGLARPS